MNTEAVYFRDLVDALLQQLPKHSASPFRVQVPSVSSLEHVPVKITAAHPNTEVIPFVMIDATPDQGNWRCVALVWLPQEDLGENDEQVRLLIESTFKGRCVRPLSLGPVTRGNSRPTVRLEVYLRSA